MDLIAITYLKNILLDRTRTDRFYALLCLSVDSDRNKKPSHFPKNNCRYCAACRESILNPARETLPSSCDCPNRAQAAPSTINESNSALATPGISSNGTRPLS